MKTQSPLLLVSTLVILTAGVATARSAVTGTCLATAPSNPCGPCKYESQCGGTDTTKLCRAQLPKSCRHAEAPKPAATPQQDKTPAPSATPEPEAPTPSTATEKTAPEPAPQATPPVIAITATVKPAEPATTKVAPLPPEQPAAPVETKTESAEPPATEPEAPKTAENTAPIALDGTYVPTQSQGVLGLGAGFDIEGDHMHEVFNLGCTSTLALQPVRTDEAEVRLVERFGASCRKDARPAVGTTVGSIDTLQRGPGGEALELLVEMPALTRVRRAFRAARLGDGDYKAGKETWVQLRGTAAIVRQGECLVLARTADRGLANSAELRLIEVSGCDNIAPAPGATIGKIEIAATDVIDAEEVTTALQIDLQGTRLEATRQTSGPPMSMRRGVTSNWTGAYEGPEGATLTLLAPHSGTYALHDGETSCQLPLEVAQVSGAVEARVSTAKDARIRAVGCPAFLPGQLAFRLEGLRTDEDGSLVTMAHNGMTFSRPGPDAEPIRAATPRMMAASIRSQATGTDVVVPSSPGFARGGVEDALKAGKSAVDACYQRRVQMRRGLAGNLFLAWQVNEKGTAFDVRVLKDSLEDGPTARCVVHAVRRMRFPAATDGAYEVRTPFRFTAY